MLAGTLQTLGLRPPIAARSGVFRREIVYRPAALLRSSGDSVFPAAHPPRTEKTHPIPRSIRATGGSDEVVDDVNYYSKDSNSANVLSWTNALLNFAVANFLPIALIGGDVRDCKSYSWMSCSQIFLIKIQHLWHFHHFRAYAEKWRNWCSCRSFACRNAWACMISLFLSNAR